jgi:hypothetical protein
MKNIIMTVILFALSLSVNAQQVSLFDKNGEATAYIDYGKEAAVFLWDGTPVAFLENANIISYNREFLGWYQAGILYDKNGNIAAVKKMRSVCITKSNA